MGRWLEDYMSVGCVGGVGCRLEALCRALYYTHDQWSCSAPVVILFLSPHEELVGDGTIAVQKESV